VGVKPLDQVQVSFGGGDVHQGLHRIFREGLDEMCTTGLHFSSSGIDAIFPNSPFDTFALASPGSVKNSGPVFLGFLHKCACSFLRSLAVRFCLSSLPLRFLFPTNFGFRAFCRLSVGYIHNRRGFRVPCSRSLACLSFRAIDSCFRLSCAANCSSCERRKRSSYSSSLSFLSGSPVT
jgi:hypothetical protein